MNANPAMQLNSDSSMLKRNANVSVVIFHSRMNVLTVGAITMSLSARVVASMMLEKLLALIASITGLL